MGSYYRHTRTESVDLPYSFRCEQCMQDSGSRKVTVTGTGTENSNFKELSDKRDEKLRESAHKDLVKTLKALHEDATEKQVISTIFSDECPHCHKPQSWGVTGMKKKMYEAPITIFCVGIFISLIGLLAQKFGEMEDITTPIIVGIAAVGTVAAIISLIWNVVKINMKIKKTATGMQKNLPIIEWESVQYLLNES